MTRRQALLGALGLLAVPATAKKFLATTRPLPVPVAQFDLRSRHSRVIGTDPKTGKDITRHSFEFGIRSHSQDIEYPGTYATFPVPLSA